MKTKSEKVTYQWLSYNHRNFHCTRFPIFRWTEPCCSTYDEQTDRVELTTAIGNLRCLIYGPVLRRTKSVTHECWISDDTIELARCVKISKNTQQHNPKKKKYMRVPYTAVFEWGVVIFFFKLSFGFRINYFLKNTLISIVTNMKRGVYWLLVVY